MKRKHNEVDNMAYKFAAYPTEEQRTLFAKTVGCVRFVYNHMLADKKSHYEATKENINPTPAQYKKEFEFLKEVDSLALANSQMALNKAFLSFYKGNTKFPKYKAKHRGRRAYTTNCVNKNIKLDGNYLTLPKMGAIRIKKHRTLRANGKLKSVTFSQDSDGKYYVSILYEYKMRKRAKTINLDKAVGLDMSMKELFVSSDGQIGNYPRYYRAMEEKLAREQRKLSKMVQGSNNYYRQKRKIGKLHAKIKHQRRDFLHQTSRTLVDNYDVICIEDLDMKAMAQALNFGKSVCDNGWGIFRSQLVYKLAAENKNLVIIDKWFPSSKTCIECGYVHHSLTLSDRIYICPVCGNIIDRDYQAANNIKNEGFRILLEALLKDLEPQELAGIAC
jgi:putative transposase